jgi:anaerobic magnesium-protoporphyrin IX monomethyl ester cyclase
MFDFLFVNPSTEREARGTYNREPPTGLLILSAILRQHGYSVDLLDCSMEDDPKLTIRSIAKQYRGIGFTCLTNTYNRTIELIKIARSQASNALIVMGGPHASFMTETILRDVPEIDLVCKGEFEDSIVKLFRTTLIRPLSEALDKIDNFPLISKPQIQELPRGVAIRVDENNRILFYQDIKERPANNPFRIHDTGFPEPVDINSIPLPARDILIPKYYVANILVNRGCVNQCSFCSRQKLFGKKPRIRNIQSVSEEIDDVLSYSNYKFLNFYDNVNMNPKWFREFLSMLIRKRLRIPWGCELRADILTAEDVNLMKKAGCVVAATGVESADEEILRRNFKYQNPDHVKRGILLLKNAGIRVQSYFVIGLPGETEQSFEKTLEYLKSLQLDERDEINFFIATPYPGSSLGDNPQEFGARVVNADFDKFDCSNIILEFDSLPATKILELKQKAEEYIHELRLRK